MPFVEEVKEISASAVKIETNYSLDYIFTKQ
jgi:hypothetical protein